MKITDEILRRYCELKQMQLLNIDETLEQEKLQEAKASAQLVSTMKVASDSDDTVRPVREIIYA